MTRECERLTDQYRDDISATPGDINTQAYDKVRARWVERHIWDDEWGVLPGMAWPHEKPMPGESLAADTGSVSGSDSEGDFLDHVFGGNLLKDAIARGELEPDYITRDQFLKTRDQWREFKKYGPRNLRQESE